MPWLGLGVLKVPAGADTATAVTSALDVGYRHFDTAPLYGNEPDVGSAVISSLIPRSEVFVTTKVWNVNQGFEPTIAAFAASLSALRLSYVDLYLVHWPFDGNFIATWRALEKLYSDGKARAIGVSNFQIHHLEKILAVAEVQPMVNQVEMHPLFQQHALREYCKAQGIQLEAWSPLMRGDIVQVPALAEIGNDYDRSAVQVALRWLFQLGIVSIPKTIRRTRMESNAAIFDFELTKEDMGVIESLDEGRRLGPHPDEFRPPRK